ncbi:MAG: EF2563 family selenium-dependent molybdenum hydroxylase system protein [Deltaproteobacteria bacterium]|nr:EF2563 family selenium-dependent molybdenum hydroxylase system protein [Deltaproteobacteria bacterium]
MALNFLDLKVLVRGGGEMASAIACRLHHCHMRVFITEVAVPTTVRRMVAFAEAVYEGSHSIEGVQAVRVSSVEEGYKVWEKGGIPVLVDPQARVREVLHPVVIVDAIMAKKNSGTDKSHAPLVIGVGPGFTVGTNVHAVVETNRGHNLGRVLWQGQAEQDTGVPAPVSGYTNERVLRVPHKGLFKALYSIGDPMEPGKVVAQVDGYPIQAQIKGVLRGLLKDGISVEAGMKAGDIDPRGEREYCYLISDKARAIAGGVLEAILHSLKGLHSTKG